MNFSGSVLTLSTRIMLSTHLIKCLHSCQFSLRLSYVGSCTKCFCIYTRIRHISIFAALRKFTIWNGDDDNGSDFGGGDNDNGSDDGQEREKEKKALFVIDSKKMKLTVSPPCSLLM